MQRCSQELTALQDTDKILDGDASKEPLPSHCSSTVCTISECGEDSEACTASDRGGDALRVLE